MPVVDASVWVALFKKDEAEHETCRAWLERALEEGEELAAPALVLPEVGAALGRGTGDVVLAARAVSLLEAGRVVRLHAVAEPLASRAAAVAIDRRLRGADAVYVALAEHLGLSLVSLDRQHLERGAASAPTAEPRGRPA